MKTKNEDLSNVVLYETNYVELPLGTVRCTVDTGNLKLQEEIEIFLKYLKFKYIGQ